MTSITLTGVPDSLKERLENVAGRNRRSLSQQALLLLEGALAEKPDGFDEAYQRFREKHGPSPLQRDDLKGLRSEREGQR